jgi:hypothetical protein
VTQHGKRNTPAGPTFTIDSSCALVDAGDGANLGLQIFVGERDLVATSEVSRPGLVHRRVMNWRCRAFYPFAGRNGESLNNLLKRLDSAIGRYYDDGQTIDEVNSP